MSRIRKRPGAALECSRSGLHLVTWATNANSNEFQSARSAATSYCTFAYTRSELNDRSYSGPFTSLPQADHTPPKRHAPHTHRPRTAHAPRHLRHARNCLFSPHAPPQAALQLHAPAPGPSRMPGESVVHCKRSASGSSCPHLRQRASMKSEPSSRCTECSNRHSWQTERLSPSRPCYNFTPTCRCATNARHRVCSKTSYSSHESTRDMQCTCAFLCSMISCGPAQLETGRRLAASH